MVAAMGLRGRPRGGAPRARAHLVQTHAVPDADWGGAGLRGDAGEARRSRRLRAQVGRPDRARALRPAIATLEREARPDETRFPRAFEVSIRGAHDPALADGDGPASSASAASRSRRRRTRRPSHVSTTSSRTSTRSDAGARVAAATTDCPFTHAGAAEREPRRRPGAPGRSLRVPGGRLRRRPASSPTSTTSRIAASTRRLRAAGAPCASAFSTCTSARHCTATTRSTSRPSAIEQGAPVTLTFRVGDAVARERRRITTETAGSPSSSTPANSRGEQDAPGRPRRRGRVAQRRPAHVLLRGGHPVNAPRAAFPEQIGWRDHVIGAALGAGVRRLAPRHGALARVRARRGHLLPRRHRLRPLVPLLLEHGHDALKQGAIDGACSNNHEHPALMKTLFGVSWWLLHEKWHVFTDASTAYRFPAMMMGGRRALGHLPLRRARLQPSRRARGGGAARAHAARLLPRAPRVLRRADDDDVDPVRLRPLARAGERTVGWAIAAGIVFGLTLETKHNAWILPAVLVPHALFVQRQRDPAGASAPGGCRSRRAWWRWRSLGPIVFLRCGRTSGTTRWRASSGTSSSTSTTSTTTSNFSAETTSSRRRRGGTCR